jgi:hypothetical protein
MSETCPDVATLKTAIQRVKDRFRFGVNEGSVSDIAFIGNASSQYEWEPCQLIDCDIAVFAPEIDFKLGTWLLQVRRELSINVAELGVDFELRVIRGPYKPPLLDVEKPILLAHVSLFTDKSYEEQRVLFRWGWRKYQCQVERHKLMRLAPKQPSLQEFIAGQSGVVEKLGIIESGCSPLVENFLPDLNEVKWKVRRGEALFAEFCLAAGALCARNHARVLGRIEADTLGNREFDSWYRAEVFDSESLRLLIELKHDVRNHGYRYAVKSAPELSLEFLKALVRFAG